VGPVPRTTGAAAVSASTATPLPAPRRRPALRRRETLWALVFLAPWIFGFVVFTAGPMIASFVLSFTSYDVINSPRFVGLENYRTLLEDRDVALSLRNTVVYTVLHVPLSIAAALALALLLDRVGRAAGIFRTVFYLPAMTPPVAVGVLFLLLLNGQTGLVNRGLALVGIDGPDWTTDPSWVKPGLVLMSLWSVGTTMVILFAALRNVPEELLEAARLDGASSWQRFRHVTLPMISAALFFVTVVNTIASLQMFTEVYTMFFGQQSRSAAGDAALFYVVYLFQQAFQFLHMGYASAMAWLLFLVILAITLVQIRVSRRLVYYEGD
jgi:multiple sugar transport system permease protein